MRRSSVSTWTSPWMMELLYIFRAKPVHPVEVHFSFLHPGSPHHHNPHLMTTGEAWRTYLPVHQELCSSARLLQHNRWKKPLRYHRQGSDLLVHLPLHLPVAPEQDSQILELLLCLNVVNGVEHDHKGGPLQQELSYRTGKAGHPIEASPEGWVPSGQVGPRPKWTDAVLKPVPARM